MTYRHVLLISLMLGAALIAGCGKGDDQKAGKVREAEPPRPVRYMQVGMSNVDDLSYLPGEIRPRYEQRYGFRVAGKIARRLVDVGQEVKAGQILAVLDAQDVLPVINAQEAQVEVARSDLKLQQSDLKRQQQLRDKNFVSEAALEHQAAATDAAQSRLQAAQAQLANVKNGLDFQTLRADQAGVVMAVDAEAGSVVAAGQSVVRVAQLGEKEIAVSVPERDVALIKKAVGFTATFDAIAGKIYAAKLRELSPAADAASRTYSARLSIIKADDALKLGMSATVRLQLGTAPAIVVPNTALYTRDNTTRVWLVERATATVQPVAVTVGDSTNDGVVIVSGLKPGDLVVTAGANLLLPGQKVRLLGAAETALPATQNESR
jgi:RND family efflux transporter MFP subunit